MKKHAATLIMVALALALGLWLWLDRDHVTSGERSRRANNVFPVWRKEALSEITIVHDGETLVLKHAGPAWRLEAPRSENADAAAVDRLLTTLEFATVARPASEGASLGLEAPRARGTLRMGTLIVPFALGGASPRPENSSYFRVGDGAPIVVGKELAEALTVPSDVYRDRAVVPYLATELARFQVAHAEGGFTLERVDERSFKVTEEGVLASRTAVERMWAALAEMRAEAFPKDADVDRLTARPTLTITMSPKDARAPATLVIGDACPEHPDDVVVLRTAPTRIAACAPKDVVPALLVPRPALLERHPFTLRMDEIEELRLENGARRIEFARKGTGFHLREPANRDLTTEEADAASEAITRLASAEAEGVTRGGAPFIAVASAKIHAGDHEQAVEIAASAANGHAVLRRLLDDARLDASPVLVRLLLARETTLRPHAIVEGEARRATRVILRCGVEQELVDRGEGFRFVTPAGFEADGSIAQLTDAILRGRVDPWVADADDGTFGLGEKACRVLLVFADDKAPLTVWFGNEGEGGFYGRTSARPGVFVAPRALRELAGRIYVSRGSLRTEASRIEAVRVNYQGRPVPGDANALREAAVALYADRVVLLGKKDFHDLIIDVVLAEGGPPRRIACGAPAEGERLCAASAVDATFGLAVARLQPFLPPSAPSDAGVIPIARDGGAR